MRRKSKKQLLPSISQIIGYQPLRTRNPQFEVPSESTVYKAIGEPIPLLFTPGCSFEPLPTPGPSSWLNQHAEDGQTFDDFLKVSNNQPTGKRNKIYLLPIGTFDVIEDSLDLNVIVEYMTIFFQMKDRIQLLPSLPIYESQNQEVIEYQKSNKGKSRLNESLCEAKRQKLIQKYDFNLDAPIYHEPFPISDINVSDSYTIDKLKIMKKNSMNTPTQNKKRSRDIADSSESNILRKMKRKKRGSKTLDFSLSSSETCTVYFKINDDFVPISCRRAIDHDLLQLYIPDVLSEMRNLIPEDAFCVIGITLWDMYMDDTDLFVVGWAGYYCAVFSFARYDPLFVDSHNKKQKDNNPNLFIQCDPLPKVDSVDFQNKRRDIILRRSLKTVTHETLHLFGLRHCIFYSCLMNGTASLHEDDQAPLFLCPVCLRKLHYVLGFSIIDRYKEMLNYFKNTLKDYSFQEESTWLSKRLKFLEQLMYKEQPDDSSIKICDEKCHIVNQFERENINDFPKYEKNRFQYSKDILRKNSAYD